MVRGSGTYIRWTAHKDKILADLWASECSKSYIANTLGGTIESISRRAYMNKLGKRALGRKKHGMVFVIVPKWVPPVLNLGYQAISSIYGEEEAATWARTVKGSMS